MLGGAARAQAQTSETPPIDLGQAIARALERSPEIGVARADADEAHASARLADAAFQPEAFVTTTPGYSSGLPIQVAGQVPSLAGRLLPEDALRSVPARRGVRVARACRVSRRRPRAFGHRDDPRRRGRLWPQLVRRNTPGRRPSPARDPGGEPEASLGAAPRRPADRPGRRESEPRSRARQAEALRRAVGTDARPARVEASSRLAGA